MPTRNAILAAQRIERAILLVRAQKVMLDADLAVLYGVPTKVLIQAVKRNSARFPGDFMFRLTAEEAVRLRSQIVTSNVGRGRQALAAIRFHRTWRRYDVERPSEYPCHAGHNLDDTGHGVDPPVAHAVRFA